MHSRHYFSALLANAFFFVLKAVSVVAAMAFPKSQHVFCGLLRGRRGLIGLIGLIFFFVIADGSDGSDGSD